MTDDLSGKFARLKEPYRERCALLVELTDRFSEQHLNPEYKELARKLILAAAPHGCAPSVGQIPTRRDHLTALPCLSSDLSSKALATEEALAKEDAPAQEGDR